MQCNAILLLPTSHDLLAMVKSNGHVSRLKIVMLSDHLW